MVWQEKEKEERRSRRRGGAAVAWVLWLLQQVVGRSQGRVLRFSRLSRCVYTISSSKNRERKNIYSYTFSEQLTKLVYVEPDMVLDMGT